MDCKWINEIIITRPKGYKIGNLARIKDLDIQITIAFILGFRNKFISTNIYIEKFFFHIYRKKDDEFNINKLIREIKEKLKKKAKKQIIEKYKDKLAEALTKLTPILIDKAADGDLQAIKEVNDRVMGKPHQTSDITTQGLPIIQIAKEILDKHEIDASPEPDS